VTERFLERLTWPEVEAAIERGVDAVLLPIGTTEQHGPHMPLETDCFIARSLCARAAEAGEAEAVELIVAPTLNVTLSWYHMQYPGSLRLSTTTFLQVFREVCESLHQHFGNVVAVNGHGGNIAALTVAVNHYFETTGRRVFLAQWWDLASDVLGEVEGPLIHAEEAETVARDGARADGLRGSGDARRLRPERSGEGSRADVDLARALRDAPEGPRRDRADGHAPRHHAVRGGRGRDARSGRARRANGGCGRAPHRSGVQEHGRKGVTWRV
jgi:hypothetical protein